MVADGTVVHLKPVPKFICGTREMKGEDLGVLKGVHLAVAPTQKIWFHLSLACCVPLSMSLTLSGIHSHSV